jgi:hypothetical protein
MIPSGASDLEVRAANELRDHIELVSGAVVPVVHGDPRNLSLGASLTAARIVVNEPGYYPFTFVVANPTPRGVMVTAKAPTATSGSPVVEVDAEARPIPLGAYSSVVIAGCVTVEQSVGADIFTLPVSVEITGGQTFTLALAVDNTAANCLENPGLEAAGFAPWYQTGSFRPDSAVAHRGGTSIRFDGGQSGYNKGLVLDSGCAYELRFWAKRGPDASPAVRMRLAELDAHNATVRVSTDQSFSPTIDWQQFSVVFYTNPSDSAAYVQSWFNLYLVGQGTVWLDDFSLTNVGRVEGYDAQALPDGPGNGSIVPVALDTEPELPAPVRHRADGATVYVATPSSDSGLAALFAADLEYLGATDGFAVRERAEAVYIFGSRAEGALHGVYDFVEKNLGVLWTRATDIGTLYDPSPTVELTETSYRERPAFELRGWHLTGTGADGEPHSDPATEVMMSRDKLSAKFVEFANVGQWPRQQSIGLEPVLLGHNLHHWLTQSPTYQSWDGTRQAACWNTDASGLPQVGATGTQLNFWNSDVALAISESVSDFASLHNLKYVGVGQEDNDSVVQIPQSSQAFEYAPGQTVEPTDPKYLSTVFFAFINDVARRVRAQRPEVVVTTYAYVFTETPPLADVETNVAIVIAPINEDMKRPLTDTTSPSNSSVLANIIEWTQKTDNVVMYNYYGCFPQASNGFDRPIAPRIQADLQFYAAHSLTGVLPEGIVDVESSTKMWSISTLTLWLYSKLVWNPDADISALRDLFCAKAYGAAAPAMLEYYRLLSEAWDANNTVVLHYNAPLSTYIAAFYGDHDRNDRMKAALEDAWQAATPQQQQRILPVKEAFEQNAYAGVYTTNEKPVAMKTEVGSQQVLADFDMSGSIWGDAPVLSDFRDPTTVEPIPGLATKVRLLWDESTVYVAYECFDDSIGDLKIAGLSSSGSWWSGDSDYTETYLGSQDPNDDPAVDYRVFYTNPSADKIVYAVGQRYVSNPGEWATSAIVFDQAGPDQDRWVVIQAVPAAQVGLTALTTGTALFGYFNRAHYTGNGYIGLGWGAAPVWSNINFRAITLSES